MTTTSGVSLPGLRLVPAVAHLLRDPYTLRFGVDGGRAVMIDIPVSGVAELLEPLDGSHGERSSTAAPGISGQDARNLVAALRAHGLLVPAAAVPPPDVRADSPAAAEAAAVAASLRTPGRPATPDAAAPGPRESAADPRRRGPAETRTPPHNGDRPVEGPITAADVRRRRLAAKVVVTGRGRLAAPIALALARSGVGHVRPDLAGTVHWTEALDALGPAAVATPRGPAVAAAIELAVPGTRTGPCRPQLVVQAGADRPATVTAAGAARRRQAILMVEIRDGCPIIGPLVAPRASPCLDCLDRHRADRDPAWPDIAAQLATTRVEEHCDHATLLTAAAFAAAEALAYIDGHEPQTAGGAVEITAPGRLRRRRWPPHPLCGCSRTRR